MEAKEQEKPKKPATVKTLADIVCEQEHFAQDEGGKLYRFSAGAYRSKAEEFVRRQVKALLLERKEAEKWSSRLAEEVVEFVRVDSPHLWERPPKGIVNVKNGLLRLADCTLLPHSPDHLSTVQIPVKYDPEATCPEIEKFVGEVFPADAHCLAWEIPAWLMRPCSVQKAVLLTGEGANGKSTWLNLLTVFLGKPNVSGVSLHKLEADKFAAARLVGKLANVCADLPSKHLEGTSVFKALTGDDTLLDAERKFKEAFEFEPFCRLVFSANHPPRSGDSSHAFFRRWLVVPFDRTFGPEDAIPREVLDAKLTAPAELSGLLNKAVNALEWIDQHGGLSEPESCRKAWQEFHAKTDPLSVWLESNTLDDPSVA